MQAKAESLSVELKQTEIDAVAGGQSGAYCVYGANGTVGVNDFNQMVCRPLQAGETCGG